MILIKIKAQDYSEDFLKNGLPNFIKNTLPIFARNIKYSNILQALKEQFNLTIKDVADAIPSATSITTYRGISRIVVSENKRINDFKLDTILRFLEYGNIEIKGSNLISDYQQFLFRNFNNIYKNHMFLGGTCLWQ